MIVVSGTIRLSLFGLVAGIGCLLGAGATADDLSLLSDEFGDIRTQSQWKHLGLVEGYPDRIASMDINATSPGHLYVVPREGAWYGGYHGAFLFKEIQGDFVVWTRLHVTGRSGGIPRTRWTLSGLLARKPGNPTVQPRYRTEDWLYLMTGRGPDDSLVVDAKTTRNSEYIWDITPIREGWVELALVRVRNWFISYCRHDGGLWVVRKRTYREDLPAFLQVGLNMTSGLGATTKTPAVQYNSNLLSSPERLDNITHVDFVRFRRPTVPPGLRRAMLVSDLSSVSDGELRELLSR